MFDIIGTIISVAVSMTLILLLRHADKGNRSLEKIKKYTDRVRSEFDSYFIQQEEKLKNMSVITESNTDKSVAVVKRLEKQYEDFAARSNVLDQRFQMMNDIESRLSAYKEASQQVFEMTTRLEQNLENLHKESEIIDQVSKKIAAQKQSVATLESKISEVAEQFSKTNADQLKDLGTTLLAKFTEEKDRLESIIAEAQHKADNMLTDTEQRIKAAYDEASDKAIELQGQAFDKLAAESDRRLSDCRTMIEQKGDILQSDMFEHIEKIHRAIETDLTEMQKNIEQSLAENRQLSSQLDTEINNCKIALIQIEDQIQQQATDVEAKYTDLFNQIAEEIDTQEKEAYNQFSAESAANREQAITILNEKLSELTDTAASRITAISEDTELRIKDLQSSISSYMTELQTSLDKAETDSRLRADTIADTSQTFLDDLQENINGRIIEISDTLTNKVDQIHSNLSSRMDAVQTSLEQAVLSSESISQQLSKETNDNSEILSGIQNRLETRAAQLQSRAEEAFEKAIADFDAKEKQSYAQFNDMSNSNIVKFRQQLEDQLEIIQQEITSKLANAETDTEQRLAETIKIISEKIEHAQHSSESQLTAVAEQMRQEIEETARTVSILETDISGNSNRLEILQKEISRRVAEIKTQADEIFDTV